MAYTAWAASTAFSVGDVRRATSSQNSGLVFECTTAGTSGSSEPTWPTDIGSTLTDNTVVWTAISSIYADLSALAPDAIIELFELHYDNTLHGSTDILRWHAGSNADVTGNITWNSNDYVRLPVQAEGFEYTNGGTLPRPTLSVANLDGAITALLLGVNLTTPGNDLTGAKVKRIRTLKSFSMASPPLILTQRFLLRSGLLIARPLNHEMLSALSWPASSTCQTRNCLTAKLWPTYANGSTAVLSAATQAATTLT